MNIHLTAADETNLAVLESDSTEIHTAQDALDLLANCAYQGASGIIIRREHLHEAFFDLKNGMAGEILQKFSNYRMRLAVVGDFSGITSKSLRDFIYESNKTGRVLFVPTLAEAKQRLAK